MSQSRQRFWGNTPPQFGKYKGKSFRWLLQNDVGYTTYLIKHREKEEAAGVSTTEGHYKASLLCFVGYARSFGEIESLCLYESEKPAAQAASEDDQLVGFGNYAKSTWREVWDNRADGFASFILRTKTHSGSRMYRLQQYLRKKESVSVSSPPVLASSAPDEATMMDDDEELERAMLSITPSKLQVHSFAVPVAAAAIPGVSPGAKTVPPPALSKPASGTTAELRASPVDAPGRKRKTPVPLPPQLTFLVKETAGSIKAERPESSDGPSSSAACAPGAGTIPSACKVLIFEDSGKDVLASSAPDEATMMDDDEELERAMLSITPSKLQVHSFAVPVAAAAIPGVSPGAKTIKVPPPALSKPASGTTAELRASPVDAPGRKRKTPVPLPPQLTFLVKETAGSIKAERPESSDDMTSWSCSQHQKLWMRTELQDLGLWPGSPPVRNPGNAISLPQVIVGTGGQYYIMSSRLCCKACRRFWFADNLLPAFLTYKKAICKSVMDELRRTGHSPGDMANQVNELMQLKYERAHLAYLHAIESVREAEAEVYGQRTIGRFVRKENTPRDFGPDGEKDAWCGISVSSYYLTDCLLDEFRRQEPAMSKLLQSTFGQVFRSDHTRKVAQKVTLASGAMSSYAIMNENWLIVSWVMVQSESEKSLETMYQGLAKGTATLEWKRQASTGWAVTLNSLRA
ncbi:hypothetical protein NHX12_000659 [Muraenolepis orangiensis]|uniref:Uncharacterized protein n=1 Tax=Muraenolepis orangiensis TaxID=630683 RepID=A0A9Q0E2I2_9TELE|nr:hypothetical protein NHX12_000659 [Muraenolepis orangiensis]